MISYFVLDVDGVLTKGNFFYTYEGKVMKEFGPDDADALKILAEHGVKIIFMSQDKRGILITRKRVSDMGFELLEIPSKDRAEYIKENFGFDNTAYMGDSFVDIPAFKCCKYGICPSDASDFLKPYASYVTSTRGGERAVAEAVFWLAQFNLGLSFEKFVGLEA